jgi:tRNA(Ile)-lysidine synthase TilS/MesJ
MYPDKFAIISKKGNLGKGSFPLLKWHKTETENLLKEFDIKIEHGELPEQAEYRGSYNTVSDQEHSRICSLYIQEGKSMNKIAKEISRSTKTIKDHIDEHNRAVQRSQFCPSCRRVKSECESLLAKR